MRVKHNQLPLRIIAQPAARENAFFIGFENGIPKRIFLYMLDIQVTVEQVCFDVVQIVGISDFFQSGLDNGHNLFIPIITKFFIGQFEDERAVFPQIQPAGFLSSILETKCQFGFSAVSKSNRRLSMMSNICFIFIPFYIFDVRYAIFPAWLSGSPHGGRAIIGNNHAFAHGGAAFHNPKFRAGA